VLCVAIDIARLRKLGEFTAEFERVLAYVRDVPLEAGVDAVRFPGESGAAAREARLRDGVPVQDFCWERLERLAAKFGIPPPARHA
jgi:LDH2 family malate/lactate/ureidoglycolate dehydrogenase